MRIITIPFACAARKSGRSGVYYSVLAGLPAIRKNQKSEITKYDEALAKPLWGVLQERSQDTEDRTQNNRTR